MNSFPSPWQPRRLLVAVATATLSAQDPTLEAAWRQFRAEHPGSWQVEWHPATGTPAAIFGPGLRIAARVTSAAQARDLGHRLLRDHAPLLGHARARFVEASAVLVGQVWALRYDQYCGELPVVGGHAGIALHQDGTVAEFGAVTVPIPDDLRPIPTVTAAFAVGSARSAAGLPALDAFAAADQGCRLVLFADVDAGASVARLCWEVRLHEPSRPLARLVFVDAGTGEHLRSADRLVHCREFHRHAGEPATAAGRRDRARTLRAPRAAAAVPLTGNVLGYVTPGSDANGPLANVGLPGVRVVAAGIPGTFHTDENGDFSIPYAGTTPVAITVDFSQARRLALVDNRAGARLSQTLTVTPGVPAQFQLGSSTQGQFVRAELDAYYHTDRVNGWVRSLLRPADLGPFARLDGLRVHANDRSMACNAYFDPQGFTTNFFAAGAYAGYTCTNSAIREIVYHEWGHALDETFGSPSPWIFEQAALGEAWGDILGAFLTDQSTIGASFGVPGRNVQNTYRYPVSAPDPHTAGQAFAGFAWDMRQNLTTRLGRAAAIAISDRIVVGAIAFNPTTQPAAVRRVFELDDDDGILANGTPHYDDLAAAATAHGFTPPPRDAFVATIGDPIAPLQPRLLTGRVTTTPAAIAGVDLVATLVPGGTLTQVLVPTGNPGEYRGLLPSAPAGTNVSYRYTVRPGTGAAIPVQGGSYTVAGTTPALTLAHQPEQVAIGTTTTLRASGTANGLFAVGFGTDAGPTSFGNVVVLDLGGTLQFASAVLDATGSFARGLPVPNATTLVDSLFYTQIVGLDAQLQPLVGNRSRLLIQR